MNNKFTNFVKKAKIKVISRLLGFFLLVCIVVLIGFLTNHYIVNSCFFLLFIIVISISTKKDRLRKEKYKLNMDVDSNIYIPLVLDNDYLNKISKEINNYINLPQFDNLVNYVQYMIDNKHMVFLEKNFKLNEAINLINDLLMKQNYNCKININDILNNDNEIFKLRRKDKINCDYHDLALIRSLLEENNLELICFFSPNDGFSKLARIDGYILTIVSLENVDSLKKIQIELQNKLNNK